MAQVIQHKRGSLDTLRYIEPIYRGEIVLATGSLSIHNADGPNGTQDVEIAFIGGVSDYEPITKFLSGGGLPSITTGTHGTYLNGILWYDSSSGQQYELRATLINDPANSAPFTSSHVAITSAVSNGSGVIGTPADLTYTDGFFDTFTSTTTVANAIDEISEAFLDLAPAKAAVLTSTSLTKSNPTTFSGYLPAGLISSDWYQGVSAYSQVTTATAATNVDLRATGTRAGKYSDYSPTNVLIGGVSSSRSYGTAAFSVVDTRALTDDVGSSNTIDIDGLNRYNTFWMQVTASIDDTIAQTGSVRYKVSADNGAGETNAYQLFYVGGVSDFPAQTVSNFTSSLSSVTYNYLSGVEYYKTADILLTLTGSDLYKPIYNLNQTQFSSTYFTNINTGSNTPNWDDVLQIDVTRTLTVNLSSGQSVGTATATLTKPNKSNVTSNTNLGGIPINSYSTAQATQGNTQIEYFLDEEYRMSDLQTDSWTSTTALSEGELEVQNGILRAPRWGNYAGLSHGSTDSSDNYAQYFRRSDPSSDNRQNGTFKVTRNTNAFASSTPISAWGSGGELEIVMILSGDVSDTTTADAYYDLGRAVGDNSGTIKGIRDTITTNTSTVYQVSWALPAGINTGTAASTYVIFWVRYKNTSTGDYMSKLDITYS
jgi:hypothetical protein